MLLLLFAPCSLGWRLDISSSSFPLRPSTLTLPFTLTLLHSQEYLVMREARRKERESERERLRAAGERSVGGTLTRG